MAALSGLEPYTQVFIQTNLPYAERLEQGHSGQAPDGLYELAFALDKRLGMQQDYYSELDRAQADWTNGANAALQDYIDETNNIAGQTYGLFSDSLHGVEDAFVDAAVTGKLSFKDLADSIIADLARIVAKAYIVTPVLAALGVGGLSAQSSGLFGGSSGGGSSLNTMFSAGKSIYSAATSGFGSAVSAGWSAGEGFLGGMQGAISNGASYISSGLSGLFGSGGVSAASSMAAGASQAGYTGAAMSSWTAGQNAAASATSYGPGLSAISGAIMGYQNSGFKGAAAGAAGGYAGAQAGATVGTYFGPIGTAVGAVIGGMLGAIGGSKLFGGDWQAEGPQFVQRNPASGGQWAGLGHR